MNEYIFNCKNAKEFRTWLSKNGKTQKQCFLKLKRGKPVDDNIFYYLDAVEVALCFGWIDTTLSEIDGVLYQKFTPRSKNSTWSELNKQRVRRLKKLGLMDQSGIEVLPDMSFKPDQQIIQILKDNNVYDKFIKFPDLYQRIRLYNVSFYKNKDIETYNKSLKHLIEMTEKEKMYGVWNDYGRLLEDKKSS